MKKKLRKLKKGESYLVVWRDAICHNTGWIYDDDYDYGEMAAASVMATAGFFIKEHKGGLMFAHSFRYPDKAWDGGIMIPKGCVLKIKTLRI